MRLIAIAGLPGSGKSTLLLDPQYREFLQIDDIGKDWGSNLERIRESMRNAQSIIVSDIVFCFAENRTLFENSVGNKFEWICFENAPVKCAINALHRFYLNGDRPIFKELQNIIEFSRLYELVGTKILPVIVSEDVLKRLV